MVSASFDLCDLLLQLLRERKPRHRIISMTTWPALDAFLSSDAFDSRGSIVLRFLGHPNLRSDLAFVVCRPQVYKGLPYGHVIF